MLVRIVKMKFEENNLQTFKQLFETVKEQIRAFPGCHGVILLQDINDPNIFFTYSNWADEKSLDAYRKSAFFDDTWEKTKALFSNKPEAWSLLEL